MMTRKPYPSDVSDDEWACVAPYVTLMTEDAPQRDHSLREVFDGLRWIVRTGAQWRMMPNDLPPWHTVYQQTQRWLKAGVFEALVHDVRMLLRIVSERAPQPSAVIFMLVHCNRLLKVAHEPAMMVINGVRAAKSTSPLIPLDICLHCWLRQPTSRSEHRLPNSLSTFSSDW